MTTTTLLSPHYPGLLGHGLDVSSFASVPQLSTLLNDDAVWPFSDACSLLSVDVVEPQPSAFCTFTSSTSCDSARPQHVVTDNHRSLGVETSWFQRFTGSDDIQMSPSDESLWYNSNELMSSDVLDQYLSHLLTSPPGCLGNYSNVAGDWQSGLSAVSPLADQLQPSPCDVDRLCLATSKSFSNQECFQNIPRATDVLSDTFICNATDSDEGAFHRSFNERIMF